MRNLAVLSKRRPPDLTLRLRLLMFYAQPWKQNKRKRIRTYVHWLSGTTCINSPLNEGSSAIFLLDLRALERIHVDLSGTLS